MKKINLEFSYEASIANIELNDGKGNVLDNVMMNEILEVLKELKNKKDIKLIVFQGSGPNFSFGASVPEHTKERAENMIKTFHRIFYFLIELGTPTLSKISGKCLGGGMELTLFSNFIFADKTALFGQPEIVLGVFPPPASLMLPLKIGQTRAEDLLICGNTISAWKGKEIGLLNEVFEDKKTMNEKVDEWILQNIIPKSASSLKYAVKSARTAFNDLLIYKLPLLETIYLKQLMETRDANEGILAFIEKRKPIWENC